MKHSLFGLILFFTSNSALAASLRCENIFSQELTAEDGFWQFENSIDFSQEDIFKIANSLPIPQNLKSDIIKSAKQGLKYIEDRSLEPDHAFLWKRYYLLSIGNFLKKIYLTNQQNISDELELMKVGTVLNSKI